MRENMTEEYKSKFNRYIQLMNTHYDKVKDKPELDLINNADKAMTVDKALDILENIKD